jgi:ribosomal protein L7/L12
LCQAKELVEGAPAVLAKGLKKADAEALIVKMKECGAVVEME